MGKKPDLRNVEILDRNTTYTIREICVRSGISSAYVVELVEHGIIEPVDPCPANEWCFDLHALTRLQRALRLQHDLDINLPGLATSLDLLDEVQLLRQEVERLQKMMDGLLEP